MSLIQCLQILRKCFRLHDGNLNLALGLHEVHRIRPGYECKIAQPLNIIIYEEFCRVSIGKHSYRRDNLLTFPPTSVHS